MTMTLGSGVPGFPFHWGPKEAEKSPGRMAVAASSATLGLCPAFAWEQP